MADNSKIKEEAKKEIRSLLLSAPAGLTLDELEQDYCLFFGKKLPSAELGYASTEEFLQDIPDTVEVTYKGGTVVLTGIADVTTKHIQKLVSHQRLDTRKNWGTLKISTPPALSTKHKTLANRRHTWAYTESSGSRNRKSSPDQGWRQQAVHPVRDIQHADLRSHSHHRHFTTDSAPLLDSPPAGHFSYSHHRTFRRSPLLTDNQPAGAHSNSCHRNIRSPLLGDIRHTEPHSNAYHRTVRTPPFVVIKPGEPRSYSHHRNVGTSPPLRDVKPAEPRSYSHHRNVGTSPPLRDVQPAEPCSYSHHRNVAASPPLRDVQPAEPCSNSYHKNARTVSPLLDNGHAHTRPQSLPTKGRPVPLFIRNKVDDIVKTYSDGVPLIHFSNIFRKHFGITLDFWRLGFTSLFDCLSTLEDLVVLRKSSIGETWVAKRKDVNRCSVYNGIVDKHREMPELIHRIEKLQFPQGRTI